MSNKSKDVSPSYSTNNSIKLIKGGLEYFTLVESLIDNAKHSIYIRIYIWDDDRTGTSISNHLIAAVKRNVSAFVIADGYASQRLSRHFVKNLKSNGVHFRFFEPLLRSTHFYLGRRMHEKLIVVDGQKALVGGVNFADRYNEMEQVAWLDYALLVEGESASRLNDYCASSWPNANLVPLAKPDIAFSPCSVRIRRNDWVKSKHEIWSTFSQWINCSNESITIMCSYFIPGRVLKNCLSGAAKRGVKIKLILAGPCDIMLAKYAERYLYRWMLRNNIEVYEYQPSVLHAKMMVVDNHWFTIGSFNVNNISTYASMELNLDVRNKPFATSVQLLMDNVIENDCIRITEKNFQSKVSFLNRFLQKASYEIIRVVLNLSTFYFKHE